MSSQIPQGAPGPEAARTAAQAAAPAPEAAPGHSTAASQPIAPAASPLARRAALAALALACGGAGAWYAWQRLSVSPEDAQAGALLRSLNLPDAQGNPYALASLAGKTVVLNFWATWCPPCVDEMPELATLHQEISTRNGLVIGIGIDSAANIRQFASTNRFPYPLLVGGMGGTELSRRFGNQVGALPFTVVIKPDGSVAHRTLGRIKLPRLREIVLAQLKQPA